MPLIELWEAQRDTVEKFTIQQVVSFSGDGTLKDGSECSRELQEYFSRIPSEKLNEYADQCLAKSFDKSGLVLQDLVNELGRRLDFIVENGRYSGTRGEIGNDGLWLAPEGNHIVAEVKTTDAYRMSMDTISGYRDRMIEADIITENSSILVVVGREDTGELEAQVRGSRHAWDIRLISVEALAKLVSLKENSDEEETTQKIRSILRPVEYTRVDSLVDVVFTTASDIDSEIEEPPSEESDTQKRSIIVTDRNLLNEKRSAVISAMSAKLDCALLKRTRALYWSADRKSRVACTIFKRYENGPGYWYAFHPSWQKFLEDGANSYFVLGCMGRDDAFAIPLNELLPHLRFLNVTQNEKEMYWHIHLEEDDAGNMYLLIPRQNNVLLSKYSLPEQKGNNS